MKSWDDLHSWLVSMLNSPRIVIAITLATKMLVNGVDCMATVRVAVEVKHLAGLLLLLFTDECLFAFYLL